ncbi:hypothetical protein [Deinococcus cellulosilyticus]|uniref:Uncharacterized protein n=1 Tax=Deinococcus cellulosilyticus (strain DSM 18568 / NBRC 106333 / KACC 11606 / 5516J-15) TaxID=1223518 RepID=A0A511MXP0_DEIC1|nr:hypothetical protein [Deinococcus cellulosilyticus]GEM45320.1 hypothetical protein DC3_09550 [Deinococcus cellulosilyticus NBRC 106333 = KACC 11606]
MRDLQALNDWGYQNGFYRFSNEELKQLARRADVRLRNAKNHFRDVVQTVPCKYSAIEQADLLVQRRLRFKRQLSRFMRMVGVGWGF